jgi:hypothetical protein
MKKKLPIFSLLSLLFILTACGGTSTTNTQPTATPAPTQPAVTPTPTPTPHYKVGDSAQTADGWQITLDSAKIIDPTKIPQYQQIFVGMTSDQTFLEYMVTVKNVSSQQQAFRGGDLSLADTQGNSNFVEQASGLPDQPTGVGGPIAAGMQSKGGTVYIVPKATKAFYLTYTPQSGPIIFWDINV